MIEEQKELYHYGILGQKWGIRNYQNYDGTYTQAGLKRYYSSKETYENKKSTLSELKSNKASNYEIKKAKAETKNAKSRMNADYKHLKEDKAADKGKIRYINGERIRNTNNTVKNVGSASLLVSYGAYQLAKQGWISENVAVGAIAAGTIATGAATVYKLYSDSVGSNRQLRAYYGHTSNYYGKKK